ncbi:hypothetical protein EH183_34110 [Streptomyces sp. CB01881]|nr:hypothetical protein EH183_34110 [Streptomyces sp. CB01881]
MIPTTYTLLDTLPLTPNGKTDYRALPTPEPAAESLGTSYRAPRSAVEAVLAAVWQDVLGVDRIGVDDDFFALGGHSLLAARVHNRLRAVFGVEVPLRLLFSEPTVARLAAAVEAVRRAQTGAAAEALPPLLPGDRAEPAPLSFAQRRLWFLEGWEPGTSLYHITAAVRLRGPFDVAAFRTAWQRLIDRHDVMRAHVDDGDPGEPRQVVRSGCPAAVPLVDLSAVPEGDRGSAVTRLVNEVTDRPFELTTGPLWRVALLRLGPAEHVLAIGLHHLIADGHSLEVLLAELGAQYEAAEAGRKLELPALPVQFADYARWQRGWLEGDRLSEELGYWKKQLGGLPAITLPTDRAREAARGVGAAIESVQLSASADARLQAISREAGVTPFMALLAVFAVALGQNRDLDEVVVGTPIVGRSRAELEGLIGFFANTLVLRLDLAGDPTFRELLGRAREVCLDAYAHQDVPFERVVQELRPERSDSHLPLFQTWFVVQEAPAVAEAFAGLGVEPVRHGEQQARYDLRLDVQRIGDTLRAVFEYKTDLFESASVARLARRFGHLLEVAAVEPDARLSALTRQVGEADDRARRERRGSVSLASLKRLKNVRREITQEAGGSKPAEGGIA